MLKRPIWLLHHMSSEHSADYEDIGLGIGRKGVAVGAVLGWYGLGIVSSALGGPNPQEVQEVFTGADGFGDGLFLLVNTALSPLQPLGIETLAADGQGVLSEMPEGTDQSAYDKGLYFGAAINWIGVSAALMYKLTR